MAATTALHRLSSQYYKQQEGRGGRRKVSFGNTNISSVKKEGGGKSKLKGTFISLA